MIITLQLLSFWKVQELQKEPDAHKEPEIYNIYAKLKKVSTQASTMLLSKATVSAGGNMAPFTNAISRLVAEKSVAL